jgi:hypothetical protein
VPVVWVPVVWVPAAGRVPAVASAAARQGVRWQAAVSVAVAVSVSVSAVAARPGRVLAVAGAA